MCWTLPKKSWNTITKYEKKGKGLGGRGRLTDATADGLQNYVGVDMRQNVADLKSMKPSFLASLFHFYFTIHIDLLAQIIAPNIMLIEQITPKLIKLAKVFEETLFIKEDLYFWN